MKAIITTFAIAAFTLLGAAPQAEAKPHHSSRIYISGYRSCGTPIYTERYFIGYDRCGEAIWGTRLVREEYREERVYRPVVRERYVEHCPEPDYEDSRYERRESSYRGDGISIQAVFGR